MKQKLLFAILLIINGFTTNAQCTYFKTIAHIPLGIHTFGIKNDGTLWAWGRNNYSQLGDGTTTDLITPTQIGVATNWVHVTGGTSHSLAITADGKLWAWGLNNIGQLGDGTLTTKTTPTQIGTGTNWVTIKAGYYHTLGITSDGKLWSCGLNDEGELGNGTNISNSSLLQVGTATNWVSVAAGGYHSLGITADGKLWSWGANSFYSALGDGTNVSSRNTPTEIGAGINWVSISAGLFHSLAISSDGKLWAWGRNLYGALGDGTNIDRNVPTQIGTATNWVSVVAGFYCSYGMTADGKIWAWGNNGNGQLGYGTTISTNTPTQIGIATNWTSLSAGGGSGYAFTSAGEFWAWGANNYGNLGNGNTTNQYSPTLIGTPPVFNSNLAATGSYETAQQGQYNLYQSSCALIAAVTKTASPMSISGSVTAKVWVETTQPSAFVKRHYEITPATNASTANGRVTLYFTQQEFTDFNTVNSVKLPINGADIANNKANLRIEKRPGISGDGTGLPGTYTGTPVDLDPVDVDIIWNATDNRWEVSFDVTGFSGFFVKTMSGPLPLRWLSINGNLNAQNQATIQWQVEEMNVANYQVERSNDGRIFTTVGHVISKGDGENNYSFTETQAVNNEAYYRVKQIDHDGRNSYSIVLKLANKPRSTWSVSPNPIQAVFTLTVNEDLINTDAEIINATGLIVKQISITQLHKQIDISSLSSGVYFLKVADGSVQKIIKE